MSSKLDIEKLDFNEDRVVQNLVSLYRMLTKLSTLKDNQIDILMEIIEMYKKSLPTRHKENKMKESKSQIKEIVELESKILNMKECLANQNI